MNNTMSLDELAGTSVANSFDMTSGSVKPADQGVADRKVVPVMVGGSNLNADTVRASILMHFFLRKNRLSILRLVSYLVLLIMLLLERRIILQLDRRLYSIR